MLAQFLDEQKQLGKIVERQATYATSFGTDPTLQSQPNDSIVEAVGRLPSKELP